MATDYDKLLEKAYAELPNKETNGSGSKGRFEVPKVKTHLQGNKTVIDNFYDIAKTIGRDPEQFVKRFLKLLGTPGDITKSALILGRIINDDAINEKLNDYVKKFVLCSSCGKPDTQITIENKLDVMKCLACGTKKVI